MKRIKNMTFRRPGAERIYYAKPLEVIDGGVRVGYRIWQDQNGRWFWMPDNGSNFSERSFEACRRAANKHWRERLAPLLEAE